MHTRILLIIIVILSFCVGWMLYTPAKAYIVDSNYESLYKQCADILVTSSSPVTTRDIEISCNAVARLCLRRDFSTVQDCLHSKDR